MRRIQIYGGNELSGEWKVQGSKNGVLPIMAAALMCKGTTIIRNCPDIHDVWSMAELLREMGVTVEWERGELRIDASELSGCFVTGVESARMRASILLMGALLGRCHQCELTYPGGCSIGKRPIDYHIMALRSLGAEIREEEEKLVAIVKELSGTTIHFPFPSVGATENAILAAVLAEGTTILENAAREPEIMELCFYLNAAGANITGCGSHTLRVEGVAELRECTFEVSADRIVAGTYLAACLGCGGDITLRIGGRCMLEGVLPVLRVMGAHLTIHTDTIRCVSGGNVRNVTGLWTNPFPGFPTDMQSQVMAVLTQAEGESSIQESVFESRFQVAKELQRMGADIVVQGQVATIRGRTLLKGCQVQPKDLRGGAALVIAGLMAEGETIIQDDTYICRGYEDVVRDLCALHAQISYC